LGSYAFLWGAKQEYTETWFGLFSKENKMTEPIDAIQEVFTEKEILNPAPTIKSFSLNNKKATDNITIKADSKNDAFFEVDLPKNMGNAKYKWRIIQESTDKKSGGDREDEATEIGGLIKNGKSNKITFLAPSNVGHYRLFVSVLYNDKLAYANIPFKVIERGENEKQAKVVQFKFADMKSFDQ
jgi:hypothetical protein